MPNAPVRAAAEGMPTPSTHVGEIIREIEERYRDRPVEDWLALLDWIGDLRDTMRAGR